MNLRKIALKRDFNRNILYLMAFAVARATSLKVSARPVPTLKIPESRAWSRKCAERKAATSAAIG